MLKYLFVTEQIQIIKANKAEKLKKFARYSFIQLARHGSPGLQ
jgi:hypothetical protein